jgi:hypothetical protein
MEVKKNGSQPSGKGPEEYFTGNVRIDPLFEAPDPARARGASVTFEPGALGMAYPSARANFDRHFGVRVGAKRRRTEGGDPAGRRNLVPAE